MIFYDNDNMADVVIKSVQNVSWKSSFFVKANIFSFIESDSMNV